MSMKMNKDGHVLENLTIQVRQGHCISQRQGRTSFPMWRVVSFWECPLIQQIKCTSTDMLTWIQQFEIESFFLSRKYIVNIYSRFMKGKYQLHKKDEMRINLWYQKRSKYFFVYQKPNGLGVPFIMGIQTKWMLDTMVKLSHKSIIAMDSTFSTNKYGVS